MSQETYSCTCCLKDQEEGGNPNWWKRRWKGYYHDDYNRNQDCYYQSQSSYSTPSVLDFYANLNTNSESDAMILNQTFCDQRNFKMQIPSTWNNLLCITLFILLAIFSPVSAYPTNACDWNGSGTPDNVVQAVYLRCQQGHILWERPKGGLRVNISPPKYIKGSPEQPFRLCLESDIGSNFKVLLEQNSPDFREVGDEHRKLLPFIAPKKTSTCYRISSPTATLYVESQNQQEEDLVKSPTFSSKDAYQVKISYEIEELNNQEGFSDDECRPCSDEEVLQLYCVADVVARGEILSVQPSTQRKEMDTLHIKSNLVIHQNHEVFQPLKPGNKNLQKFLAEDIPTFDQDAPKRISKSKTSSPMKGIISHPTKCMAQSGPGEFLWLIKLSFGRPKIGCVVYWDKWMQVAQKAVKTGTSSCPLVYNN